MPPITSAPVSYTHLDVYKRQSKGFISLNVEYIDGTKIESKANKYTFVWRKTVERNRERLMKKIHVLLGQIDDVIAQEKYSESNEEVEFTPAMLTERCV